MTDLTLILKWQLQPTTVLLRTTPTRPNDSEDVFPRWLSKWQSQPTTVLRTTPTRPNDSEDVFPHWLSKWKSQPTTVLLRTIPARPNDSEDVFHTGCRNGSHNQQQSFSGLHQPDQMTLKMSSTLVVEMAVATNNSPSQDYTKPDDQPNTNTDLPGFGPFTIL